MDRLRGGILVTTASKVRAYSFMVYVAGDCVKDLAILVGMACSGRMVTDGGKYIPPPPNHLGTFIAAPWWCRSWHIDGMAGSPGNQRGGIGNFTALVGTYSY